ncbi:ABC transporter permease subunit [Corynebacterium pseudotuberculosis]|uniref:ABC transporter permease subunit n=1 Tax=Corynebacterium pseudotuberculosis TaxID=1719 RepID=UPI0024160E26|nr:ABC transporter permease subunit [Corynebacterium pseudotuberculosis]WFP67265.1 ABC transporter permease subunit [Corynebacterium pseudotuberculosis]
MSWFSDLFALLTTASQWWGTTGYLARIGEHIGISLAAVAIAAAFAIPVGVAIGHTGRGSAIVGAISGAARALPTLGLLTIFGLALGIGLEAPLIALVILAIPSLLAGAYAGVASTDHDTVDAARAMGYTEWQIIKNVELPLGAAVLVGGIRSATLQVTATATLAAYTSDVGLGRFIFHGLKARDYIEMLGGSVLVIVLALILDLVLSMFQRTTGAHSATA